MDHWITGILGGLTLLEATVLTVGGALLAAFLVEFVLVRGLRVVVQRSETELDDVVLESLRWPVVLTVALAGLWVFSQTPIAAETLLDQATLDAVFGRPALSVIVVAWAWSLNRVVERGVDVIQSSDRHFDAAPVFSNVWTLAVAVGAIGLLLTIWRIEITPLLGAAGIAGIAIGFAAKDTVANFFGGLALFFDDTYKLGDFVVLESGDKGTVVKIGIRSTTLLTRDEVLVTIPNSMLNAGKVVNESVPQRRKRTKIPLGVAYGTDLDAFEAAVLEVAASSDQVLEKPEPRMRFRHFGASGLEYELLCWVPGPTRSGRARHELLRGIDAALRAADIEIPYPKRDVALTGATRRSEGLGGLEPSSRHDSDTLPETPTD
jgi:small-conductance mechanosensitive channel